MSQDIYFINADHEHVNENKPVNFHTSIQSVKS